MVVLRGWKKLVECGLAGNATDRERDSALRVWRAAGGPLHSTTVVVYYLYQQASVYFHAGYSAAIACVLFVVLACFR